MERRASVEVRAFLQMFLYSDRIVVSFVACSVGGGRAQILPFSSSSWEQAHKALSLPCGFCIWEWKALKPTWVVNTITGSRSPPKQQLPLSVKAVESYVCATLDIKKTKTKTCKINKQNFQTGQNWISFLFLTWCYIITSICFILQLLYQLLTKVASFWRLLLSHFHLAICYPDMPTEWIAKDHKCISEHVFKETFNASSLKWLQIQFLIQQIGSCWLQWHKQVSLRCTLTRDHCSREKEVGFLPSRALGGLLLNSNRL